MENAITYFFVNLGLLNLLLALTAFLLGLILGWLLWGKLKNQISSLNSERDSLKAEINSLKTKNRDLEDQLKDTGDIEALKAEYDTCKSKRLKLEESQISDQNLIAELRNKLEDSESCNSNNNQLTTDLANCKQRNADLEAEKSALLLKIDSLSAPSVETPAIPEATIESPEQPVVCESRAFFSNAISSGKMREDAQYGLLYNSAPDEVDDLTQIKGVAGVLNEKLNEYGVYTFRQIALWSPQICEDFSDKLSFKGRIQRDDWIGQCKEFHKEKYGESI